jgi:hypothetical protein
MKILEFFQDPSGDFSMTRLIAFVIGTTGCYVAITSPSSWQTITALIGGGAVSLLTRTKSSE